MGKLGKMAEEQLLALGELLEQDRLVELTAGTGVLAAGGELGWHLICRLANCKLNPSWSPWGRPAGVVAA